MAAKQNPPAATGNPDKLAAPARDDAARQNRAPSTREKIRAGMGDVLSELVEVWSDADHARATGLATILDAEGRADKARLPNLPAADWLRMYREMRLIRLLDERMSALQHEGRLSFYADARGQEATVAAPLAALQSTDWIVPAHREAGVALLRGLPLPAFVAQQLGNAHDLGKGRQMPAHPVTPRELRVLPMSWCAATQLPQATGLAWAAKIKKDRTVVLAYLGEGATSAEDFHTGVNFAAVFNVPAVFMCVNNGWAGATPAAAQSASETFAVKALAYGMPGVRVDGNDVFALYAATRDAVERARRGDGPTLIEAVTYRMGGHNAADDARRYRSEDELATWAARDPLKRLGLWLKAAGQLDDARARALDDELNAAIRAAVTAEETVPPPALRTLIEDVYVQPPATLEAQLGELERVRAAK